MSGDEQTFDEDIVEQTGSATKKLSSCSNKNEYPPCQREVHLFFFGGGGRGPENGDE